MSTLLNATLVWIGVSVVGSLLLGRFIAVGKGKPLHWDDEQFHMSLGARCHNPAAQHPSASKQNVA